MQNPLKVLMLVSSYPRGDDDSASIFLRHLTEQLHDRGLDVYVLAPADRQTGTVVENGVTVKRFSYWPRRWRKLAYGSGMLPNLKANPLLWFQTPFFAISMFISLLGLLRKVRPHVLHAHWVIPQGFIAALATRFYRIPMVITIHGGDAFALTGSLFRKSKQFSLRHSSAWTTNTSATANAIVRDDSIPAPHVIPMGVNVEHFASGRRERLRATVSNEKQIVLFVGRLVEKKGVDNLLTAFSMLPSAVQERSILWIIGGGEQEVALRALAEQLGIAEMTTFWGEIPNEQLPDYYTAADVFVGPSVVAESGDTEGQGVVFIEAFAAKLCVLATRTGGIAEVVEDGQTGILVEPRSPSQLAAGIERLLTDPQMRTSLAANAYNRAKTQYDWKTIATEFEALYRRVI